MNRRKISLFAVIAMVILLLSGSNGVQAQEAGKISLTITPPLISTNIQPGENWASYITVVNNNSSEIDVYLQLADFFGREEGGVDFKFRAEPVTGDQSEEETAPFSLYRWIDIERGPIKIPAQQSKKMPFVIKVPVDAEPGGHYGAILTGNKPPEKTEGTAIKISSLVATLLLIEVKGDVREAGDIREFSTAKTVYRQPEVGFTLRFANKGNIHLQPRGDIKVTNFFGKEKAVIPINHQSDFGNVLPESTRKYTYQWQGEKGLLSMGRYQAEVVLTYGKEAKQSSSRALFFWVIDWFVVLPVIGGVILFILLFVWSIKFYIKRSIKNLHHQLKPQMSIKKPAPPVVQSTVNRAVETSNIEPAKREPPKALDLRNIKKQ